MKLKIFTLIAACMLLLNYRYNPPHGRTGAPGEQSCSDPNCHGGANDGNLDGSITIEGLPDRLEPGQKYNFQVKLVRNDKNTTRGGFQLVFLNTENGQAGVINDSETESRVETDAKTNRQYFEHKFAKNFDISNDTLIWSASYTAPDNQVDSVKIYIAGILSNSNFNNSGDTEVLFRKAIKNGEAQGGAFRVSLSITKQVKCSGEKNGAAEVKIYGGQPPYNVLWSTGAVTRSIKDLPPGSYSVKVTDAAGAKFEDKIEILNPTVITHSVITEQKPSCGGNNDGILEIKVNGGVSPYTVLWPNGIRTYIFEEGGTSKRDELISDHYIFAVEDAIGCQYIPNDIFDFTTTDSIISEVEYSDSTSLLCFGDSLSLLVKLKNIGDSVSYSWSDGLFTNSLSRTALAGKSYTLLINDLKSSCTRKIPVKTISQDSLAFSFTATPINSGQDTFGVKLNFPNQKPKSITWKLNGVTIAIDKDSLSNLSKGIYVIETIDSFGCRFAREIRVLTNTTPILELNANESLKIYPNPVSDILQIELKSDRLKIKELNIFDIKGRVVIKTKNTENMNVSTLNSGLYILELKTNKGSLIRKFSKINR